MTEKQPKPLSPDGTRAIHNAVLHHLVATLGDRVKVVVSARRPDAALTTTVTILGDDRLAVELIRVTRAKPQPKKDDTA